LRLVVAAVMQEIPEPTVSWAMLAFQVHLGQPDLLARQGHRASRV
jgi:hypothetical protein